MDEPRYDVFFTGKLLEGVSTEQAQQRLAALFKTEVANVARLFNGKPQALKRNLSKAEALRYKSALHKAGLMIAFKAAETRPAGTAAPAAPAQAPAPATETAITASPTSGVCQACAISCQT